MLFQLVVLSFSVQILVALPCTKKDFGQGSVAVVCDEKHQDVYEPIVKSDKGIVQVYTSTKSGKRFEKTQTKFNQSKTTDGTQWHIQIDKTKSYQKIIGFGTSFSDAAVLDLGSMSSKLQRQILSDMFSQNGIQYSVVRTTIAGSDFSTRPYSYDDYEDDYNLAHFSLVDEDTKFRIPQMKLTNELAKHKVKYFGSPWSGPAWLKTNHKLNGGGTLKEGPGSKTWETYAHYLLKWLQAYRNLGVEFWGMTVQNEPMAGFTKNYPWNAMGYTAEMERDFVKTDLGPTLEKAGWTPDNFTIMIMDHNRDLLPKWADTVLNDKQAAKYIKGVAVHWYGDRQANFDKLNQTHYRHSNHFLLATEACIADWNSPKSHIALGHWNFGEAYALDIIRNLINWSSGWVDWNMVLDMSGGPNWAGHSHTASAPIIVNSQAQEYYKNPMFYALGHFSKFLPLESQRIHILPESFQSQNFYSVAFKRPDHGVVVIVINTRNNSQSIILDDPEFGQMQMQIQPNSFTSIVYYD